MRFVKALSMLFVIAGLALGFATCASAQIVWTLNDVTFTNGNTATGYFVTNSAVNDVLSYSLQVTGPASNATFVATNFDSAALPGTVGYGNAGYVQYIDLVLASNLTNAPGTIPIASGYDCNGCGVLVVKSDTELIGTTPNQARCWSLVRVSLSSLAFCVARNCSTLSPKNVFRRRGTSSQSLPRTLGELNWLCAVSLQVQRPLSFWNILPTS